MKQRLDYIDIAKGLSIVLVALFHSKLNSIIPEFIGPMAIFRMPLFFFLSGMFFSYTISPKYFILNKSEALLKPYFLVLIALSLLYFSFGKGSFLYDIKGVFYGNGDTIKWTPMWFLTHLFSIYVFTYILFRFCKFGELNNVFQLLFLCIFVCFGLIFIDFFWYRTITIFESEMLLQGLPFSLDIIFISSSYFILGYILKNKLIEFTPNLTFFLLSLLIFFCISIYTDARVDFNKRVYNDPFFSILGSFVGIYFILTIAWVISYIKWLSFIVCKIGQASLFILIFHSFLGNNMYALLVNSENSLLLISIFSFFMSIILSIFIKYIVTKSNILSLAFYPLRSNQLFQKK